MLLDNPMHIDARVYKEALSLVNNGYDVTIYCQQAPGLAGEELLEGIKIIRVFPFHLGTTMLVDKYLKAHFDLYHAIKEKYDIYHCHDTETWPIGYMLAQESGAKLVCDSHEFFPDYICREWYTDLLKYELTKLLVKARGEYIRHADKVIVVSEEIADKLQQEYDLPEKPTVIYNTRPFGTIPQAKNLLREKYGIDDRFRIMLFQGNMETSRGIEIAIKVLPYVENTVFVAAGAGKNDYISRLRELAENLGVSSRVIFTGLIPNNELLLYSSFADVLVYFGQPLLTNMEFSLPNKFFDYIFAERPLVICDLISMKRMVQDYGLGEVVNVHQVNIKEIAETINRLLSDKPLQEKYITNIRKCKPLLSWEKQEEKLLALYHSL